MTDNETPRSRGSDASPPPPGALPATVLRFDIHQRLQHGFMALSFVFLVVSGWPLAAHDTPVSRALVSAFGGLERCSLVHRAAALVLIAASLYHVFYLAGLVVRGRFRPSMVPGPGDARDLLQNLAYFVGRRSEKPKFPRFTYFEKFDYWAVFWGVAIMVGSGLVRWFPVQTTRWLPPWVYEIAHFAHTDEALLAALAIFIWHFYNVHLRPPVFPMSPVFLTGRLTLEELAEEHRAEYEELLRSHGRSASASQEGR